MFESVILIISILFLIFGLIGSIIPIIPGPILSYLGIVFSYAFSLVDISLSELLIISLTTILVFLLDYIFQYFGVKKLGGGRMSLLGLVLGTILGLLFAPFGLILGPFFGAFAGAILENKNKSQSIKVAVGSLIGFISGTIVKFSFSVFLLWIFLKSI
tara:strand:+ start:975 stop:1448 length:474 start_codon:yes stop_codon:yes gene_type:complete